MTQAGLNFVLCTLPLLEKFEKPEKGKTKGTTYIKHKISEAISNCTLKSYIGGEEELLNMIWENLHYEFKKKGIIPSHYRKYTYTNYTILELLSIEKE